MGQQVKKTLKQHVSRSVSFRHDNLTKFCPIVNIAIDVDAKNLRSIS